MSDTRQLLEEAFDAGYFLDCGFDNFIEKEMLLSAEKTIVFVYGTLKKTECRGSVLSKSKFLGTAKTEPKFLLYEHPYDYPCLVYAKENGKEIEGELYEVNQNTLQILDSIEGVAYDLYKAAVIPLKETKLNDGVKPVKKALVYVYNQGTDKLKLFEGTCWTNSND